MRMQLTASVTVSPHAVLTHVLLPGSKPYKHLSYLMRGYDGSCKLFQALMAYCLLRRLMTGVAQISLKELLAWSDQTMHVACSAMTLFAVPGCWHFTTQMQ